MTTTTIAKPNGAAQRVLPEKAQKMATAVLPKAESEPILEQIGACLDDARRELGWTLDELACKLPPPPGADKRDPRQVQRWIDGKERCQVDAVFGVCELREPFVIALAKLAECDVETTVTIRRRA